jgi:hypothetical protein
LRKVVAYSLERRAPPTELLPIAGVRVDGRCEGTALRVTLTRPSGVAIQPDDRVTIVTSDFLAGGGDAIFAPAGPLGEITYAAGAPLLREAVIAWLKQRGGRVNEQQFISPENRRWSYPAPRPVVCQ